MAIRSLIDWRKSWNDRENVRVEYKGAVLQTYERNGYDDSDFIAIVYDVKTDTVKEVEYASTRHAGGGDATVDATEDIRDAARYVLFEERIAASVEHSRKVAREVAMGKEVFVTATKAGKDRKLGGKDVKAGTIGTVVFVGDDRYRRGAKRFGILTETGERIYGGAEVFEVVDPESYEVSEELLRDTYSPESSIKSFYRPRVDVFNLVS